MTRRLPHIALLAAALLAGCDSATTTRPDAELIVGTWTGQTVDARTVVGISVPVLDLAANGDLLRFTFRDDDTYSFEFDPADGTALSIPNTSVSIPLDQSFGFAGNYTLDEDTGTIFLTPSVDLPLGLTLGYDFSGDNTLDVIADDPETLAALVGLATDSEDIQLLASVITGGSVRTTRSS